jgi:hypothetical protein
MAVAELGKREGELEEGARYESQGFTWCKIGSIALIALFPKGALLLASALAIYYYARALALGVTRSCCILRHPLLIIAFWMIAMGADLVSIAWPYLSRLSH